LLQSPTAIPSFESFAAVSIAISRAIGVESLPEVFTDSSYGRQWGNLLTLGTIHLSPTNSFSDSFWGYLNRSYPALMATGLVQVRTHDTEGDALQFINANLDERTWALLDFSACSFEEQDFTFKIRMNYTTVPNTNEIVNYVSIGLNSDYQMYYMSGFLTLQRTINEFIFSENDQCDEDLSSIWSMPMPTAAYSQNPFFLAVGSLLGLTIVMAYLYPTSRFVKTMVEEKETRMRETLFILGLRGWAHWMSWFFTGLLIFLIITVTVTVSLAMTVLQYSDPAYIFAFVGLFSTSTMGLCFTLASLFSKAKLAAIISPVVLFATILPRFIFFGFNRYEATAGKVITSMFPATAFAFGSDIIAEYEYAGKEPPRSKLDDQDVIVNYDTLILSSFLPQSEQGVQSWNAWEGDYSFNTALGMLFLDSFFYVILGFYLDQVIPRQYGSARPFYFFVLPSFWKGVFGFSKNPTQATTFDVVRSDDHGSNVETVHDKDLTSKVFIKNLLKQYKTRGATIAPAVDHLNLTLYENQITALLGHNGAGKSHSFAHPLSHYYTCHSKRNFLTLFLSP
jgi:ATP-binding cassette subfamily A (ABC1) protein 3